MARHELLLGRVLHRPHVAHVPHLARHGLAGLLHRLVHLGHGGLSLGHRQGAILVGVLSGETLLGSFHKLGLGDVPLDEHQGLVAALIGGDGKAAQQYHWQKIKFEHGCPFLSKGLGPTEAC